MLKKVHILGITILLIALYARCMLLIWRSTPRRSPHRWPVPNTQQQHCTLMRRERPEIPWNEALPLMGNGDILLIHSRIRPGQASRSYRACVSQPLQHGPCAPWDGPGTRMWP